MADQVERQNIEVRGQAAGERIEQARAEPVGMEEHGVLTLAAQSGPGAFMARAQSFPSSAPVPQPGLTCRFCSSSSAGKQSGSASFTPAPLAKRSRRRGSRHCDPEPRGAVANLSDSWVRNGIEKGCRRPPIPNQTLRCF